MSRFILMLFLLVALVAIASGAKCKRYRTTCYPKQGWKCVTRCLIRGRREVSEVLSSANDEFAKRFEEEINEDNEERDVDDEDGEDEEDERSFSDFLEEDARDVDDDDDDDEEVEERVFYDEVEEE